MHINLSLKVTSQKYRDAFISPFPLFLLLLDLKFFSSPSATQQLYFKEGSDSFSLISPAEAPSVSSTRKRGEFIILTRGSPLTPGTPHGIVTVLRFGCSSQFMLCLPFPIGSGFCFLFFFLRQTQSQLGSSY